MATLATSRYDLILSGGTRKLETFESDIFASTRLGKNNLNVSKPKTQNYLILSPLSRRQIVACLENCGSVQEVPGDAVAAALSGGEEIQWR